MEKLDVVELSREGTFKYVLLRADAAGAAGVSTHLVRGYSGCEYHADVLEEAEARATKLVPSVKLTPLGGGRIRRDASTIFIYGYSQAFGRPDHSKTADMCRAAFPTLEVSWSNDGY